MPTAPEGRDVVDGFIGHGRMNIENSFSISTNSVGGFAGENESRTITNSFAVVSGTITSNSTRAGGFAGYSTGIISYSYCDVDTVWGTTNVAGFAGYSEANELINVVTVTLNARGTATASLGRVAGTMTNSSYKANYNSGMTAINVAFNTPGANQIEKTLPELQEESFYTTTANWYNNISWDFDTIWTMAPSISSHPVLK